MQPDDLLTRATAPEADKTELPEALLVFAHPDDEVIALGARLGRFCRSLFVHITDGAPRNEHDSRAHGFRTLDAYRRARGQELRAALHKAGLCAAGYECFGIPDQEACRSLPQLAHRLHVLLKATRPEVVITHPYEGGHPDHDACAFSVHRAVALLTGDAARIPLIIEAAFYHAGPQGIETGCFLPDPRSTREVTYYLSIEEQNRKRELLACFTTQQETLRSFDLACERFRIAPEYDFGELPHQPPLFYDGFSWGMRSDRFCALTREADASLNRESAPNRRSGSAKAR